MLQTRSGSPDADDAGPAAGAKRHVPRHIESEQEMHKIYGRRRDIAWELEDGRDTLALNGNEVITRQYLVGYERDRFVDVLVKITPLNGRPFMVKVGLRMLSAYTTDLEVLPIPSLRFDGKSNFVIDLGDAFARADAPDVVRFWFDEAVIFKGKKGRFRVAPDTALSGELSFGGGIYRANRKTGFLKFIYRLNPFNPMAIDAPTRLPLPGVKIVETAESNAWQFVFDVWAYPR
jgi:hypothetical protein